MSKLSRAFVIPMTCIVMLSTSNILATEYRLEAQIDAHAEYIDNIFLTNQAHDSTKGMIITPALSGHIKEQHWEAELRARVRINRYSDHSLNGNDQLFDLTGRYNAERNIFSLNVTHNLDSNLNSTSSDFGIVGRRINRKTQSISPQYTRLLTERSYLTLAYTLSDIDFLEADSFGFTPYITENISGTFFYDLTEKNKLTISLFAVDYTSKNDLVTYQLLMSRFGIEHEFSERLSADFLLGVSRRTSTNLQSNSFDFFGQPVTVTQEIDFNDRGLVLDAGIKWLLETGHIEGRISRDNTTDSFGGLNEVDQYKINYTDRISERWSYNISGRFEDVSAISASSSRNDRELFFFESVAYYSISKAWQVNASYRYILRKFKSDVSEDRAPHSNRIYVGLSYNFLPLSTH